MASIRTNYVQKLKQIGLGFLTIGAIIALALTIVESILCLGEHHSRKRQAENLQIFDTHFSTLPELQGLYNFSAINSTWFDLNPLSFTKWDRIGSDSLPKSLEELTMNLLLKSVKKQHALENEVGSLEREMGTQRQFVQLLALGFGIMVVFNAVLMGILWKRTSGITK